MAKAPQIASRSVESPKPEPKPAIWNGHAGVIAHAHESVVDSGAAKYGSGVLPPTVVDADICEAAVLVLCPLDSPILLGTLQGRKGWSVDMAAEGRLGEEGVRWKGGSAIGEGCVEACQGTGGAVRVGCGDYGSSGVEIVEEDGEGRHRICYVALVRAGRRHFLPRLDLEESLQVLGVDGERRQPRLHS